MYMTTERANEISGAIFMIGFGSLFYFGFWPGLLFVIGAAVIAQGLAEGRGWYAIQGSAWMIGFGIWALLRFNIAFLFMMIGVGTLMNALFKPPFLAKKPIVDDYLD